MINAEDIYFLTYLGKNELASAGTSLSPTELELLVLIDGKSTVSQVQASARNLVPGAVIGVLDKLLRSGHIELQLIDLDDAVGAGAPPEPKGMMPDASAIDRGVSSLRQNGYIVRIARRPPPALKLALNDKHTVMAALDKQLTVMVVEDDQDLAENVRMALTRAGFLVRMAANREQVVAAFRQSPLPDLVLLDVMLPDGNGFAVLANMRRHPILETVPVIMVTGTATREAVLRGLQEGADGYITKPFEIDVLLKAAHAVLGIEAADQQAGHGSLWEHAG
jgi:two-component system OmpR family response regulator